MSFAYPHFELSEERVGQGIHVINVSGEIHVSTAAEFGKRLGEAISRGATAVVIDMTRVEFIDSTGLTVLLNGLRDITLRQGRLALAISNPTVLRLFEITRLDTTFDIEDTREAALARVGAGTDAA